MEFESRGSRNLWAVAAECQRGPAPSETFIYSIAAGWHFIDFHDFFGFMGFHEISWISSVRSRETCGGLCRRVPTRSCSFGNLYSIPGSCYFKDFSWFLQVFIRFHGFRGSGVEKPVESLPPSATEVLLLQKPSLDPSWLLFHRCP